MLNLDSLELVTVAAIALTCIAILVRNWIVGASEVWAPNSLIAILYLYYVVVGPLYFVINQKTDFLGINLRDHFGLAWLASLISLLSFVIGYGALSPPRKPNHFEINRSDAEKLMFLSLGAAIFALLYQRLVSEGGVMSGYLINSINLSIPGAILAMLLYMREKSLKHGIIFSGITILAMSFFLYSGFRFRIVWLFLALLAAFYLWRRVRPNPLLIAGLGVILLLGMGFIGMTRSYWKGLSIERAEGAGVADMMARGFSEAGTFLASASVLEAVPARINHTYFDPIWVTITFPIPRKLWPGKPESQTLVAMKWSFGSKDAAFAGQAIPYYIEWYIAFGWIGLIGSSVGLGWLCRRLWAWYLERRADPLATMVYTTTLGYLYFVFSRGYLPMAVMGFLFGIFPFFLLQRYLAKRAALASGPLGRPPVEAKRVMRRSGMDGLRRRHP